MLTVNAGTDRVGIGVDPSTTFDVNGPARVRILTGGTSSDVVVTADTNGNLRSRTAAEIVAAGGGVTNDTNLGNTNQSLTANRTVTTGNFDLNIDANTLVVDGSANRVGIGTTAPEVPLDVIGQIQATSYVIAGKGSGGISVNVNDGGGNANVTFNHLGMNPEQNGNAARIAVNTDATTNATMSFGVASGVTAGTVTPITTKVTIAEIGLGISAFPTADLDVNGQTRIRNLTGGTSSDVVVTADTSGNLRSRTAAEIVAAGGGVTSDTNLGNTNQSLTATRAVTTGNFDLNIDANTLVVDGSANRVGIGTSAPTASLEVATGRVEFTGTTDASGTAGSGVLEIGNGLRIDANEIITNTDSPLYIQNDNNGDLRVDVSTLAVDASANRVGIGTTGPSVPLDVNGQARVRTLTGGASSDAVVTADTNGNLRSRTAATQIVEAAGGFTTDTNTNLGNTNQSLTGNRTVTTGSFDLNIDANTLVVDGSANEVGIGVTDPSAKLDVNGSGRVRTTLRVDQGAVINENSADSDFRVESDDNVYMLMMNANNNRVGIGVDPSTTFDVNGRTRVRTLSGGVSSDAVVTADASGNLRSRTAAQIVDAAGGFTTDTNTNLGNANQSLTANRAVTTGSFDLNIDSNTLVVDGSANEVGIGVTDPSAKLDVNGSGRVRTTLRVDQGAVINENSADSDFRVESDDNVYMLMMNANNNRVGIGVDPSTTFDVNGRTRVRTLSGGVSSDVVVTADASGNLRSRTAAQIVAAGGAASDTNLGNTNQSLTANRAITTGNFDLNIDSNTLVVDGSANRVGIGTTGPRAAFDNVGASYLGSTMVYSSGSMEVGIAGSGDRNAYFDFWADDTNTDYSARLIRAPGVNGELRLRNNGTGLFAIGTNNSDDFYIENGGNVGIGVSNPTSKLDVSGNARIRTISGGASSDAVVTADASGNLRSRTAAQIVAAGGGVTSNTNIGNANQILTASRTVTMGNYDLNIDSNTLVVDGSANRVGIGTTSPRAKLDVNSSAYLGDSYFDNSGELHLGPGSTSSQVTGIRFYGNGDTSYDGWVSRSAGTDGAMFIRNIGDGALQLGAGTRSNDIIIKANNGNVGIGGIVSTSTYKLYVSGTAWSTGGWNGPSDKRFKENVKPITSPLAKIRQLNGYNFTWNDIIADNAGKKDIGVIAQEVQKVFPELISIDNDYLGVNYAGLTAPLISAVKELDAKNTALENEVKTLKKELDTQNRSFENQVITLRKELEEIRASLKNKK